MRFSQTTSQLLYAASIFSGAFLLFWVQPLFARFALPLLGGSPSVWTTSVLFFQGILLAGYLYVHLSTSWLAGRSQYRLHLMLLLASFAVLPIAIPDSWVPVLHAPVTTYLGLMSITVGLPFFVVATTAPLLQVWFHRALPSRSPYHLYAASNAGGLIALVAYPILLETTLGARLQSQVWTACYVLLVVAIAVLGRAANPSVAIESRPAETLSASATPTTRRQHARWFLFAFVPSALLLAVTAHISTDVAATPLLWVLPLALYLLTFVLAFAERQWLKLKWMLALEVWVFIGLGVYFSTHILLIAFALHLLALFVICMVCHQMLAASRPPPDALTRFYLWLSAGGFAGGVFAALIAPQVFNSVLEYPLLLCVAAFLRPNLDHEPAHSWRADVLLPAIIAVAIIVPALIEAWVLRDVQTEPAWVYLGLISLALFAFRTRRIRFGICFSIWLLLAPLFTVSLQPTLLKARSFFGVYTVENDTVMPIRLLFHGTTIHGAQPLNPGSELDQLTYYSPHGPMGQFFRAFADEKPEARVVAVGLGTGTIACHIAPDMSLVLVEIDPLVVEIASDPRNFGYLQACADHIEVVVDDGRLAIAGLADDSVDAIVLDAFSSDAIPVHLLTLEAIELYFQKLTVDGYLLVHTSNRFVDLNPVLREAGRQLGIEVAFQDHDPNTEATSGGAFESSWVMLYRARPDGRTPQSIANDRWWARDEIERIRPWTDDYADVFSRLVWKHMLR